MSNAWEKRGPFHEERRRATWEAWRREYKGLSDRAIVDVMVERYDLSERTRYSLYHEARKCRVKILKQCFNQSDHPPLSLLCE